MLGAIIGDIVGSTREWHNIKTEDFEPVPEGSRFTDDTVMTLAVAEWLMRAPAHKPETLVECMQALGRRYPDAGYGGMFKKWLWSDNPRPYNSFGNGSAMRVSPVGMYANSLEEALELARITASVSHNHPEGIKGAQAIAACIYMERHEEFFSKMKIKDYIEETFGYNLSVKLEDIRDDYVFDESCQGSVPVAIMAFLQRRSAFDALRLAISMGGDSDTIGCMTTSISMACPFRVISSYMPKEVLEKCRQLLPPDLLDINDRFEAFVDRPLYQSYATYGNGVFYAGEYPGEVYGEKAGVKMRQMLHFGVKHFIDLTEEEEVVPYSQLLPKECTYLRFPIPDAGVPESVESVHRLIYRIDEMRWQEEGDIYLHGREGVGRTGTVVACLLAKLMDNPTLEKVLTALRDYFAYMPKSAHRITPETEKQIDFIARFIDSCRTYKEEFKIRIQDSIRGSLMAGAAGDALGYPVEFMSREYILSRYGNRGITSFDLGCNGKARVSDDTQLALFTANGVLMGITRGSMRGIGGRPEDYVDGAYLDWYYTQTGGQKEILYGDYRYTWLRDLPGLAHRRAPGNTCLSACQSLSRDEEVHNRSKGCGGIVRVAPLALLMAGYVGREEDFYSVPEMSKAGAEIARVTHKHPLGFLPAAMFTHLLFKLVPISIEEAKERIVDIVEETIKMLDRIYVGEFEKDKAVLVDLTRKAIDLAHTDVDDAVAIRRLGEGWTGEETWAIALFCAIRHIDSVEDAIMAAVNHDGDSDSTGSVTGNIMGAIYGYRSLKEQQLFCPDGRELEETLELSDIILALADDLYTGCIISEYDSIDTPEKRQWYERYCEMKPAGIVSEG